MQDLELAEYLHHVSRMLEGRIPASEALQIAAQASDDSTLQRNVDRMAEQVRTGAPLSEAAAILLSPFHLRMLAAGEANDQVPAMLAACANHLHNRHRLGSRVRKMLGYPMLITFVSSGILLLFLHFVFGHFSLAMTEAGTEAGPLGLILSGLHHIAPWLILLWALLLVLMLALQCGGSHTQAVLARICLVLPGYRQSLRTRDHARLSSLLGSCIASGQVLPPALHQAANGVENPRLRRQLCKASQAMEQGQHPAIALRATAIDGLIPLLVDKEKDLLLADELGHLATLYTQRAEQSEQRAHLAWTAALFTMMVLSVMCCLGGILAPMLQLMKQLSLGQ